MFFRVLTFQEDGTGDPLKEQTFPITQSAGLQCRWVKGNLPLPSFAARHNFCRSPQLQGGRLVRRAARRRRPGAQIVNGAIDSRRKSATAAARGRPVEL